MNCKLVRMLCLMALALAGGCAPPSPGTMVLDGRTMGSSYQIKSDQPLPGAEIATLLHRLDVELMSTYVNDSELSRFNQAPADTPFPLSVEMAEVIAISLKISKETNGAFDITVGPLVNAWGFGPGPDAQAPPDDATLGALRTRVGYHQLQFDPAARTLTKSRADLYCDLSAIAPGYAADCVSRLLEAQGHANYLVDIGGEIRARGVNAEGQPWRIGIEKPDAEGRTVQKVTPLRGVSLATSGDYRNFFMKNGKRFSHTIDPATGCPVTHNLASVSVLHAEAAWADAYATALSVLGPDAGYDFALARRLAAYFIVRQPDGTFVEKQTPHFPAEE